MEKKVPVKVYKVYKYCDDCKEKGNLYHNGTVLPLTPPRYEHECPACKRKYNLRNTYPSVVYEEL